MTYQKLAEMYYICRPEYYRSARALFIIDDRSGFWKEFGRQALYIAIAVSPPFSFFITTRQMSMLFVHASPFLTDDKRSLENWQIEITPRMLF